MAEARKPHESAELPRLMAVTGGASEAKRNIDRIVELHDKDFWAPEVQKTYLRSFGGEYFRNMLLDALTNKPNFTIVTLWDGDELVGFVYGCAPTPGWWRNVREQVDEQFSIPDDDQVINLVKIMSKRDRRGQGIGSRLHTAFLEARSEELVSLLSEPLLQPAYSIWLHWGYRKIGTLDPQNKGRIRDVLIRPRVYSP